MCETVAKVASAYIDDLNGKNSWEQPPDDYQTENSNQPPQDVSGKELAELRAKQIIIQEKVELEKRELIMCQKSLDTVIGSQLKAKDLQNRIDSLDKQIAVMKQKLASLKSVYADAWADVASLKKDISVLEQEKEGCNHELKAASLIELKTNTEKNKVKDKIDAIQDNLEMMRKELAGVDDEMRVLIRQSKNPKNIETTKVRIVSSKEGSHGYVLNQPTINFLPELWGRLIFGILSGSFFWHIAILIFRKKFTPS
jgi:chromosome segregation ATPase